MKKFLITSFFFYFFSSSVTFAQTDSVSQEGLSFDFGFTRGKNIELWPILRKYKDADIKETQVLFSVYGRTLDYKNGLKHLHFYPFLSKDSSSKGKEFRLLSTYYPSLLHSQRDSNSRSLKFLELAPNISCFGIARAGNGLYIDNNILFLFWYKNDQIAQKRKVIFFPAYWYWKDKYESNHLIFPLFKSKTTYSFSDTTYRKTLFPIYWSKTNKYIHNKVLFPILWRYNSPQYSTLTIFPLLSIGHSKDSLKSQSHFNAFLLYHRKKKSNGVINILFSIVWNKTDYSYNDTSHRHVIFPIFWSYKDSYKSNTVLFPIIWRYTTPNTTSFSIFPLFTYKQSKDTLLQRKSLNILLLFNYKKESLETKTSFFPIVWNKTNLADSSQRRVAFPLLWSYKNNDATKTVLFPVYWSFNHHSKQDSSQQSVLFPIYWSGKNKQNEHKVIFPLVWKFSSEKYKSLTIIPLFSKSHSEDSLKSVKHLNILGVYTHLKDSLSTKEVLFPIYWSGKSKLEEHKVIFPVLWNFKNEKYKSLTIIPLFSKGQSSDSLKSVKHLNILGVYTHLKDTQSTRDVLFPIFWSKTTFLKNDTTYSKTIFPIYWSYKDSANSKTVILPFVRNFETPHYKSFTLIPIFSKGHSKDSARSVNHLNILGLFNHYQTPAFRKDLFFPIVWSKTTYLKNDTTFSKTIFPLYWSYKDSAHTRKVLFPLVWSFENPMLKSFTLFPLFSIGHSKDSARSVHYFNLLGLYTRFVTPKAKKNIILPLFWNKTIFEKEDTTHKSTFFPIYWSERNKTENHKVLFPLVWNFENSMKKSFTLFPLFSYGNSKDSARSFRYFNVLGVYTRLIQDNEKKHIIFPIVWTKVNYQKNDTTYRKTVFPLYWSKRNRWRNDKVLFPIVWSFENKYNKSFTFFPLFSIGHSKDSTHKYRHLNIALLFHHKVEPTKIRTRLFPIVWSKTQYTSYDTTFRKTVFPIFWSKTSKYGHYNVLFPLVWESKKYGYSSFTIFPLLSFGHSDNQKKRHFMLTPLIGRFKNGTETTSFIFPIFKIKNTPENKASQKKVTFMWPLCQYERGDSIRKFRFAPIVWYKKTDSSSMFSIQPLHYFSRSNTQRTFILAWFLYRYDNQMGVSKGHNILWRGFNYKKYTNGDHETRFLHLVYANVKKDGNTEKSIFPLYHKKTKSNGDKSISVLFGFYNHFKQYKPEYKKFYEEERIFWLIRLRSNYKQLSASN